MECTGEQNLSETRIIFTEIFQRGSFRILLAKSKTHAVLGIFYENIGVNAHSPHARYYYYRDVKYRVFFGLKFIRSILTHRGIPYTYGKFHTRLFHAFFKICNLYNTNLRVKFTTCIPPWVENKISHIPFNNLMNLGLHR